MKTNAWIAASGLAIVAVAPCFGSLIVADNFDRSNSSALGNTSQGGLAWSESETTSSGLQIAGNGVRAGSTTAGREYATIDMSGVSGYSTTPSLNSSVIQWSINMRQSRTDPSGVGNGLYAVAFVLASSSQSTASGVGYAVVLGNSADPDPIRLVRFTGGIDASTDLTDIISGGGFNDEFLSVRVTYNPSGNNWSLFAESSTTSFGDATSVSSQIGSTVANSTHTGTALAYSGFLWNHGTSGSDSATFDNFEIQAVPEPTTVALGIFACLLAVSGGRAWFNSRQGKMLKS